MDDTARLQTFHLFLSPQAIVCVCKYYLDFSLDLKNDLKINHIFCHSGQDLFYKIPQIIRNDKKKANAISIMGGFHILLVSTTCLICNNGG